MLANFLIGLREGLEASLVIGILVAYLVRSGRRERIPAVWAGVGGAVLLSLVVAGALTLTATELPERAEQSFSGTMSVLAVGFVTWMVFWMRRAARSIRSELHGRLESALAMGTAALVGTAFVAVAREGLETALFMWSAVQSAGTGATPLVGGLLGLLLAAALGYLLYRRAVTINLATFFTWTGAALVVVAAGVLAYGVHEFQEAGALPGEDDLAFDVSGTIAPTSVLGSVVRGVLNISPAMTQLQVVAWLAYLVPVMWLFLRGRASQPAATPHTSASHTSASQAPAPQASTQEGAGQQDADVAPAGAKVDASVPPRRR